MILKLNDVFEKTYNVSENIHNSFILTFEDKNPLHTEEGFALHHGFQGKVMHGNILNGFISNFIGECLPIKNVIIHSQDIQFKNPVYLNDFLLFKAVISNIYESVNAIEFKFSFNNNTTNKIAAKGKIQIGILL